MNTRVAIYLNILFLACSGTTALAVSFSLDDNPVAPLTSQPGFIPGGGAEDEFGLVTAPPSGPAPLAPSPSLLFFPGGADFDVLSGVMPSHTLFPGGSVLGYVDSFSANHPAPQNKISLQFSVDRLTTGVAGSAVATQATLGQAPGDIFTTTATFPSPALFAGNLPIGTGYVGPLGSVGSGGAGSNTLLIDESALGLTVTGLPGALTPSGVSVSPPSSGSHDNVDAFDDIMQVPVPGTGLGVYPFTSTYFTAAADGGTFTGGSASDIHVTSPGGMVTPIVPFATAIMAGLDLNGRNTDSIDALVMFDVNMPHTFGVEPGIDFALFSLAPGSAVLSAIGSSANDIYFTDFTGKFATYLGPSDLGLLPGLGGLAFAGNNVDALDIPGFIGIPEPTSCLLVIMALTLHISVSSHRLSVRH